MISDEHPWGLEGIQNMAQDRKERKKQIIGWWYLFMITNIKNLLSNPARAHKVATDFINKCLLEALSSSAHVRAEWGSWGLQQKWCIQVLSVNHSTYKNCDTYNKFKQLLFFPAYHWMNWQKTSQTYYISSAISQAIFSVLDTKVWEIFHKKWGSAYSWGFGIQKQVQLQT